MNRPVPVARLRTRGVEISPAIKHFPKRKGRKSGIFQADKSGGKAEKTGV